jgi:hypothetical protein
MPGSRGVFKGDDMLMDEKRKTIDATSVISSVTMFTLLLTY